MTGERTEKERYMEKKGRKERKRGGKKREEEGLKTMKEEKKKKIKNEINIGMKGYIRERTGDERIGKERKKERERGKN